MKRHSLLGAGLALALLAAPALADTSYDGESASGRPMLFVSGGGNNSLIKLRESEITDFDTGFRNTQFQTGYNLGGGLGLQLTHWAAIRATYNFARSQGERSAFSPFSGNYFNRHYYGGDLQLRTGGSGFSPYIGVGGGAVTIVPDSSAVLLSPSGARFSNDSFTKPAARASVGFDYQFPNSGFGLFAEGSGWAYKWDRYGFDRTQVDTNWGAGLTYRFGY
jgi:hypothetical protein